VLQKTFVNDNNIPKISTSVLNFAKEEKKSRFCSEFLQRRETSYATVLNFSKKGKNLTSVLNFSKEEKKLSPLF